MTVTFTRTTVLPVPPERAFDLSLDVDFHEASFHASGEKAVDGVTTGIMQAGQVVTWRARHFGIWWRMTSVISAWDRPHRFVDEQQRGPFKSFWHEHRFVDLGDGRTEMHDRIVFAAPLGILGRIAEALVLRWYMPRLIDVRNAALVETAAAETG